MKKERSKNEIKPNEITELWNETAVPIPIKKYTKECGVSEKMIIFSETGAGKTRFYLKIFDTLLKKGVSKEDLKVFIIYPDRPGGLAKLYGLIPREYQDCIDVFPVGTYEDTIRATATAVRELEEHYKNTGVYGWMIFELMENYWTFAQDYYCRMAYGETMADYFAQMQSIMKKGKGENKAAYEAFAGPWGGPWIVVKMTHNFNWIDKLKRMPYNIIFTSELREEDNKDSIFTSLNYRPAGEKHVQHKVDQILYLSHKGDKFFMKPFKLTGYEKLYAQVDITGQNGYEQHLKALKELEKRGFRVSPIELLEKKAGIAPPKATKEVKKTETSDSDISFDITNTSSKIEGKTHKPEVISKEELVKSPKKEKGEDSWDI